MKYLRLDATVLPFTIIDHSNLNFSLRAWRLDVPIGDRDFAGNEALIEYTVPNQEPIILEPELWVDEYGDYLYRYAYSRLRNANSAEEVVQETFLAGVKYFSQFSGRGSQRGWLLGILKRKIIDFVRVRSKHEHNGGAYADETDPTLQLFDAKGNWKPGAIPWSESPHQKLEASELWEVVQDCMRHLPQGQADVFMLSVMEGLDSDEICRELEITASNLWVRLHRARLGLAKCVGSKWFEQRDNNAK